MLRLGCECDGFELVDRVDVGEKAEPDTIAETYAVFWVEKYEADMFAYHSFFAFRCVNRDTIFGCERMFVNERRLDVERAKEMALGNCRRDVHKALGGFVLLLWIFSDFQNHRCCHEKCFFFELGDLNVQLLNILLGGRQTLFDKQCLVGIN
jgi:hypothetical protein